MGACVRGWAGEAPDDHTTPEAPTTSSGGDAGQSRPGKIQPGTITPRWANAYSVRSLSCRVSTA